MITRNLYDKFVRQCDEKFKKIKDEIDKAQGDSEYFKQNSLPLARIKKIMRMDESVKVISHY